jgi:hypothetical protein
LCDDHPKHPPPRHRGRKLRRFRRRHLSIRLSKKNRIQSMLSDSSPIALLFF